MIERHTSDRTRTTILVDLTGDCFQVTATHTYAALVVTCLEAFVPSHWAICIYDDLWHQITALPLGIPVTMVILR